MTVHQVRHNIRMYWWFTAFAEPLFWGVILTSSIKELAHMSLADVYYMEAVVVWICVVLDIPMGALADNQSRKLVLVVGRIFLLADTILFAVMETPTTAWIANAVWAVGFSLQSNADSALLYNSLSTLRKKRGVLQRKKDPHLERSHKRIVSRAIATRLIFMAFGSYFGGLLADYNMRAPLGLCVPLAVIPLVAAIRFIEPPREHGNTCTKRAFVVSLREHFVTLIRGITFAYHSVELRWMIGFATLLAVTSKVWFFSYNTYFELLALDKETFGKIFFAANIVAFFFTIYAHRLEKRLGEHLCLLAMIACLVVPLVTMGMWVSTFSALLVIVQNITRGFMQPFIHDYMNRHVLDESIRATVLSVRSTSEQLFGSVGLWMFGLCTSIMTTPQSLVTLGVTVFVLAMLSYRTYRTRIMH